MAVSREFQSQFGYCWWHRSRHRTDFDISETADPVEEKQPQKTSSRHKASPRLHSFPTYGALVLGPLEASLKEMALLSLDRRVVGGFGIQLRSFKVQLGSAKLYKRSSITIGF